MVMMALCFAFRRAVLRIRILMLVGGFVMVMVMIAMLHTRMDMLRCHQMLSGICTADDGSMRIDKREHDAERHPHPSQPGIQISHRSYLTGTVVSDKQNARRLEGVMQRSCVLDTSRSTCTRNDCPYIAMYGDHAQGCRDAGQAILTWVRESSRCGAGSRT